MASFGSVFDKFLAILLALFEALDTSSSNENVASLKSILSEVVGGWPLITPNWNPSTFDLYRSLAAAKRLGFDSVFRWSVAENPSNRSQNIVNLGTAVLGLPSPGLYTTDEAATVRQAYRSLIGNVANLLAGSPSSGRLLDIRDFVDFETNIAETILSSRQTPNSRSVLSISAFVGQYLSTYRLGRELLNLFRNVLSAVQLQSSIDTNSVISVDNPVLYRSLGEQLASVERQGDDGKRILGNYIGWNIVFSQLPLLPQVYRDALGQFSTASGAAFDSIGGRNWEDCLDLVNSAMPNAIVPTESHYDNVRNLIRFALFRQLRKLGQPNGRTIDDDPIPVDANAYYYYDQNLIGLSLGLLQPPLYDPTALDYLNYAGIGYIYAHQLTKTFDETGALYNASGNGPQSWWSPNVNASYFTLVNALRSQYRGFPGPDGVFNGQVGAGDVIADSLALQCVLSVRVFPQPFFA
ncbi:hypothetical protein RvY_07469 [Ramazzottius varieornatus]|uniref:Peptidase M13 N-terminal domain-containing protein n=1 Tax=Ramazzottius varieornatus TaxID=947166 RepID=A0A1D1VAS3_RAMVA|nr:hypothetical protein RvY_07469 [Ramazzottius varieornatus]